MEKSKFIDFRSDVVSQPPEAMLKAMTQAEVGDDVFGDDPTTNLFETTIAKSFGKEAAIFFPSASMGSLAVTIGWCKPGQEIIIWGNSHAVDRQCANLVLFAGVLTRQLFSDDGLFDPLEVERNIRRKQNQVAHPDTTMVFAENPTFTGIVYPLQQWKKLKEVCSKKNVHLHIDGARIYHAIASYQCKPSDLSDLYDSMTICFSKSLCCPGGAVVLGDQKFIDQLRFVRKSLGGTMRQTGILTAACLWALENMAKQVSKDNQITLQLAKRLSEFSQIKVDFKSIQTNMVNFDVSDEKFPHKEYKKYLLENGIKIKDYNKDLKQYRLVIYPQIRERELNKFVEHTSRFLDIISEKKQ